jgi:general nucleoside transport system ATP-binding protein
MSAPLSIRFENVTKSFGGVFANHEVSFSVARGAMHALLGENGAGKTTLVRILSGELKPDQGFLCINGNRMEMAGPVDARSAGVRMVHQHSIMIPELTVVENFYLDNHQRKMFPDIKQMADEIREKALGFGLDINPFGQVSEITYGQRQWIEVFRAIYNGGEIIILDEPTALLSPVDADRMLGKMKELTQRGVTVIFITHKLREVFEYADEVTVLRKGRFAGTKKLSETTKDELYSLMVSSGVNGPVASRSKATFESRPLIGLRNVTHIDRYGRKLLDDVSFDLPSGMITALVGISGSGQIQLAEFLMEIQRLTKGCLVFFPAQKPVCRYVPEDRMHTGTSEELTVQENLISRNIKHYASGLFGFVDQKMCSLYGEDKIKEFKIKTNSPGDKISSLSGGNIQRVLLARELDGPPEVLIVHNPTAGLDLATTRFVRSKLVEVAAAGASVFLISDDLDEVLEISDRVLAIHRGRLCGPFMTEGLALIDLAALMVGERKLPAKEKAVGCGE